MKQDMIFMGWEEEGADDAFSLAVTGPSFTALFEDLHDLSLLDASSPHVFYEGEPDRLMAPPLTQPAVSLAPLAPQAPALGADFGSALITGDGLDNLLIGGPDNDVVNGSDGDDVLVGGGGNNLFVFQDGNGTDVVQDFEIGHDLLFFTDLSGVDQLYLEQVGADVVVHITGSQDSVRLLGTDKAALTDAAFGFFDLSLEKAFLNTLLQPDGEAPAFAPEQVFDDLFSLA